MSVTRYKYLGDLRVEGVHERSKASIKTDAPPDNHGLGEAFSPTDLTGVALATCMLTVMGIEAGKRSIDIGNPTATVEKHMASNPRKIKQLDVSIRFDKSFVKEEKAVLEKRAIECPVALSLSAELKQNVDFAYPDSNR